MAKSKNKLDRLIDQARKLPQTDATWECAARKTRSWVDDGKNAPYRPPIVMVIERESHLILANDMAERTIDADRVLQTLLNAIVRPMGGMMQLASQLMPPARPAQILFEDEAIVQALQPILAELGIRVAHATSLPAVDDALQEMQHFLHPGQQVPPVVQTVDADAPMLMEFFETADRFYRAEPWEQLWNGDIIEVRFSSFEPMFCSVMGNGGREFGLVFYNSTHDVAEVLSGRHPRRLPKGMVWLSCSFDEAPHAAFDDLDFMEAHGIELADEYAYPAAYSVTLPETVNPLSLGELQMVAATMRVLPQFVVAHMFATEGEPQPAQASFGLPAEYGGQTISLAYPVPELQSFTDRTETADVAGDWDDDDWDDDEDMHEDMDDEADAMSDVMAMFDALTTEMVAVADKVEPGAGKLLQAINTTQPTVQFAIPQDVLKQIKPRPKGVKAGAYCEPIGAFYPAQEVGITVGFVFGKSPEPLLIPITELQVDPDHPLADAIQRYQARRLAQR
jgi:hypothetical protein